MDKKIDWVGTIGMAVAYLVMVNGVLLLLGKYFDEDMEINFHIIFSVGYLLLKFATGSLVTYEGWLEDEEDSDSVYFQPNKNISYGIRAVLVVAIVYLWFS